MILLVKLILAHFIGDFFLQPTRWVRAKEKDKLRSPYFYTHLAVHAVITMLLVFDWHFWPYLLIIIFMHGIFDAIKISFQKEETKRTWFFYDQVAHLTVIVIIVAYIDPTTWVDRPSLDFSGWVMITIIAFLTLPASLIIRNFMSKWTPFTDMGESDSLGEAGKYIGILERLFVFAFVVSGRFEAIGFLVAAKSVFRFGDLRQSKDRKLTEYILIGTLLSFGLAILSGMLYTYVRA